MLKVCKRKVAMFLKRSCSFVFSTLEKVRLVIPSFCSLIYFSGLDTFESCTKKTYLLFQIRCSVGICLILGTTMFSQSCNNDCHRDYLNVVSYKSNSTFPLLHISSNKISDNVSVHNFYIITIAVE